MGIRSIATGITAWLPLLILPLAVWICTPASWPAWVLMWLMAFAIFAGSKWLTWHSVADEAVPWSRRAGYLLAWPGLDAASFLGPAPMPAQKRVPATSWLFALGKIILGVGLIWGVVPAVPRAMELTRGWIGMAGIVFVLHFGLFHLLCLCWQRLDVRAKPLMNWPVLAQSVSEFWSDRWNTAFRDLTHRFVFRPLAAKFGGTAAIVVSFLCSGLVHDLVISVPARGGYGGPTVFFLIQAAAILLERSRLGRRCGLGRGIRGWAFTALVLLGPAPLLFHPPFVRRVIVPFLDWMSCTQ